MEHIKLQNDLKENIRELEKKLEESIKERDETLSKYEENEAAWQRKLSKLEEDQRSLFEMNSSLKDDNKELMMQIDKYMKRVKQLENNVEREKDAHKETERLVHDYKRDKQDLNDRLTDQKEETARIQRSLLEAQVSLDGETAKLVESKRLLKEAEEKQQQLYQDLMNSNNKGMERWQDMQKKYEESQTVITKQLLVIDELNTKVSNLKDINNQLEYTWSQKYQDDISKKDKELGVLKQENIDKLDNLKLEHKNELSKLKNTFRDDIIIIDKELNKQMELKKAAL